MRPDSAVPPPASWSIVRLGLRLGRLRRHAGESALLGLLSESAPVDLRLLGRTLLHAGVLGLLAGAVGAAFYWLLEHGQRLILEGLAGYEPLRAGGEQIVLEATRTPFRPWLILVLPAVGGLMSGLITMLAPEARGGGTDATIEAYHHQGAQVRTRVIFVKALASLATLSFGGVGGREGPTMQIGGALGAFVARLLRVSERERRILLLAGIAAGMAAVFRTPLGAALLSIEVLYRDGFESESLVPAVLASVVAYAVVVSLFGHAALFTHAAHFPIVFRHLPLYALMAVLIAGLAWGFVRALGIVRRLAAHLPGPEWLRPAWGGLVLGVLATPAIVIFGEHLREPGHGFGLLGGGYGGVQLAISGAPWLPLGGAAVAVMAVLAVSKLLAAALTIGSGGSAGDFGPSLVIGGLAGGAFGRLAALATGDPSIDPGAFALVGMGAFFGGIAHVPLSALILVCELAGSYDLLVPLMLAEGVAFVALRMHTLYPAQLPSPAESPVHHERFGRNFLERVCVLELMRREPVTCWTPGTPAEVMLQGPGERRWQEVFPVLGDGGILQGLVTRETLHAVALEREVARLTVAADLMEPAVSVAPGDSLRLAAERMVGHRLRELPVMDRGLVVGLVGEAELARAYFGAG